jgi:hypothetical protein
LLSPIAVANDKVLFVAPEIFVHVPLVFSCHCTVGAGLPVAAEVKLTLVPAHLDCGRRMCGYSNSLSAASGGKYNINKIVA